MAPRFCIVISHVAYQSYTKVIPQKIQSDTLVEAVFLHKEVTLLESIKIHPLPTLADFKQAIIDETTAPKPAAYFGEGQTRITYEMLFSPKVSFDAYENYRGIMQPKEFTLFSSGPNKGIGRFIRSLGTRHSKKKRK